MFDLIRARAARWAATVAAGLVASAVFAGSPASAAPVPNQDLINKMDGGRLALYNDSTADGATAITLRNPSWTHRTENWDLDETSTPSGWIEVARNKAADKCLQPSVATPKRGTTIVVKPCDGSDLQKWLLRAEVVDGKTTGWWIWRPLVKTDLAMTLNLYNDGSWSSLHLDTAYPSSDRLWQQGPDNRPW